MNTYHVKIDWTNWLKTDSPLLDESDVLYMYATLDEPVYIGEAGNQTVRQRIDSHEYDGVSRWIKTHIDRPVRIKVGLLQLPPSTHFSLERLHDIETLLIFLERKKHGFCRANVVNTRTRPTARPGMAILNQGFYTPLLRCYRDEPYAYVVAEDVS